MLGIFLDKLETKLEREDINTLKSTPLNKLEREDKCLEHIQINQKEKINAWNMRQNRK